MSNKIKRLDPSDRDAVATKAREILSQKRNAKKQVPFLLKPFYFLLSISPKTWIYLAIGGTTLLVMLSAYGKMANPKPEMKTATPVITSDKDYFVNYDPGANLPTGQPEIVVKSALSNNIVSHDMKINASLDLNLSNLVYSEAARYDREAEKEARSGMIVNNDHAQATFDLANCPGQTLEKKRCVLMRFQDEGNALIETGSAKGDAKMILDGYLKVKAATIAFGQNIPIKTYDFNYVSRGITKQIQAERMYITVTPLQNINFQNSGFAGVGVSSDNINQNQIQYAPVQP